MISEFARPPESGYGAGSKTHRISTTRRLGQMTTHRDTQEAPAATSILPAAGRLAAVTAAAPQPTGFARIVYQDDRGTQTFFMTKDEIVIGRQAPDVWADLSIDTSLDVSREHARLQRTPGGDVPHQGPEQAGDHGQRRRPPPQPGGDGGGASRTSTAGSRCRTRRGSASPA